MPYPSPLSVRLLMRLLERSPMRLLMRLLVRPMIKLLVRPLMRLRVSLLMRLLTDQQRSQESKTAKVPRRQSGKVFRLVSSGKMFPFVALLDGIEEKPRGIRNYFFHCKRLGVPLQCLHPSGWPKKEDENRTAVVNLMEGHFSRSTRRGSLVQDLSHSGQSWKHR